MTGSRVVPGKTAPVQPGMRRHRLSMTSPSPLWIHCTLWRVAICLEDHLAVPDARTVRIVVGGTPAWGRREGEFIVLENGRTVPESEVTYLAPVEPSKILAVHLSYRSRVEEYKARIPSAPSFFMKPPT